MVTVISGTKACVIYRGKQSWVCWTQVNKFTCYLFKQISVSTIVSWSMEYRQDGSQVSLEGSTSMIVSETGTQRMVMLCISIVCDRLENVGVEVTEILRRGRRRNLKSLSGFYLLPHVARSIICMRQCWWQGNNCFFPGSVFIWIPCCIR